MNVIISNTQREALSNLDIDVIKSISGEYEANELVEMFKNFFYNRMILDVSALKNFYDIDSYKEIANGLDVDKIIFFLPEGSRVCTSNFLSNLVTIGIYNFTSNIEGVKYLLDHPNKYEDVAKLQKVAPVNNSSMVSSSGIGCKIIGFKDVTEHAGATTLIHMLKKELVPFFGDSIVCVEIDKTDFQYLNDKKMVSVSQDQISATISKFSNNSVILVDLNNCSNNSFCGEVIYLLEPSTIKLNKLIKRNRSILSKIAGKKVVLNKSLLSNKDVGEFEYEAKLKVFYNIPPLDDRKKNQILVDFLSRIEMLGINSGDKDEGNNKIFGLFRR